MHCGCPWAGSPENSVSGALDNVHVSTLEKPVHPGSLLEVRQTDGGRWVAGSWEKSERRSAFVSDEVVPNARFVVLQDDHHAIFGSPLIRHKEVPPSCSFEKP